MSDTTASFITTYEEEGRVIKMRRDPPFDGLASINTALEAARVTFTNGDESGMKLKRKDESDV